MREIIYTIAFLFFYVSLYSQSSDIRKANKAMSKYWAEPTIEQLEKTTEIIDQIFENESAATDRSALYLKSQLLTAQLTNEDFDDSENYEDFLDDIVSTYNKALVYDEQNQNRYHILKNLFSVKDALTTAGSTYYLEEDFQKALKYYDAASRINEVEIKFPRIARPDTSTIYSTAVMASLAGEDEVAMRYFERVVELGYYRQDAYDQLINLYKKNKYDVKAKKMEIEKKKAFPPEQND
jgi:tetratricopeptide (TPR) repeat protein